MSWRTYLTPSRLLRAEGSVAFYTSLFGTEPAKRRPGCANFAIGKPPPKLVLIEGTPGDPTRMDHLSVEVQTTDEVTAAAARLAAEGLAAATEGDTACCYAVQDKVWVTGPATSPGRSYVVTGDADVLDKAAGSACCAPAASTTGAAPSAAVSTSSLRNGRTVPNRVTQHRLQRGHLRRGDLPGVGVDLLGGGVEHDLEYSGQPYPVGLGLRQGLQLLLRRVPLCGGLRACAGLHPRQVRDGVSQAGPVMCPRPAYAATPRAAGQHRCPAVAARRRAYPRGWDGKSAVGLSMT
jgi:hypothetical protein